MKRLTWPVAFVLALTVAVSVSVATATADDGNSANAHLCQKGGWMNLARTDGTGFNNTGECVSYAAKGGTLEPKSTCTAAGSEDFSEDAELSQPTTFSGGTIDTAYGDRNGDAGGVKVQGSSWGGPFPDGTHLLYTGQGVNTFQLTFTNPVGSVQLDAHSNIQDPSLTNTLTAYDASNNVIGTATAPGFPVSTLSVSSASNNIKYFTIATNDPATFGLGFTNIVWGCA